MSADKDHLATQKAAIYDLEKIIERDPRERFTNDEIKSLMDAYIEGSK